MLTDDKRLAVPALPGDPVDATGGGDSYMGGFLVGYLRSDGDPWEAGLYGRGNGPLGNRRNRWRDRSAHADGRGRRCAIAAGARPTRHLSPRTQFRLKLHHL